MDAAQDWRTMDAGWELNRLIAARLGYTVEEQPYRDSDDQFYFLLDPQRQPVIPNDARMQAMVDGVKRTVREYSTPERAWRDAPDVTGSVDAAVNLMESTLPEGYVYAFYGRRGSGYRAHIEQPRPRSNVPKGFYAMRVSRHPAMALCEVWLAWQDALSPQTDV